MPFPSDPSSRNSYALALLRIGVGVLFLIFGEYKVFGTQFTLHGGFQFWINKFLEAGAYPFMAPMLRGFVLSHATSIAFFVAYGELAIGLALFSASWCVPQACGASSSCSPCSFLRIIPVRERPSGSTSAQA